MEAKVSSKYQIVIPKAVRKQLRIKRGQKVSFGQPSNHQVTLSTPLSAEEVLEKYAGILKDTPWQKKGIDAAVWIRRMRDTEWD